jgi:methoxymalonate biosynthesis protein
MPRKALIWDGDDSLWQGTLTAGDLPQLPPGRYELCQRLHDRGVLQAVASRNLLTEVEATLYALGLDQFFLANQADFERSKPQMIRDVMAELGLVRESDVVYVDDDPMHIAEVRAELPEVAVHWARQGLLEPFVDLGTYFYREIITEEDRNRVASYRNELKRKQAGAYFGEDRIAFFKTCEMWMNVRQSKTEDLPRIIDLVSRANQTAACAERYSEIDLNYFHRRGELWVMEAGDKFGDYGLSGVLRRAPEPLFEKIQVITLLVISCRLQGKGYGSAFLGWAINTFSTYRTGKIVAWWLETPYNSEVRKLYEWYSFTITKEDELCKAQLPTTQVSLPTWISIT